MIHGKIKKPFIIETFVRSAMILFQPKKKEITRN
jgi:hypothetical protein